MGRVNDTAFKSSESLRKRKAIREGTVFADYDPEVPSDYEVIVEIPKITKDNFLVSDHFINVALGGSCNDSENPLIVNIMYNRYAKGHAKSLKGYFLSCSTALNDMPTGLYFMIDHEEYRRAQYTLSYDPIP